MRPPATTLIFGVFKTCVCADYGSILDPVLGRGENQGLTGAARRSGGKRRPG